MVMLRKLMGKVFYCKVETSCSQRNSYYWYRISAYSLEMQKIEVTEDE